VSNRFQILSLDGGGIKGLFSAAVLAHLEEDLNTRIVDHFDLIVGTSTGGIIALGLGCGLTPSELVKFYVTKGPQIFAKGLMTSVKQLVRPKYSSLALEKAIKECVGDATLGDSKKRLVIPAYNVGKDDVYLFKTPHHERLTRDYKVPVWKVALATSAAPTYFPAFVGVDNVRLIDGGVWANNPMVVGIAEAVSLLEQPIQNIHVLSLGTTSDVVHRPTRLDSGGIWPWCSHGVDVILRGQSRGAVAQAIHLLGKERVMRLDPVVPPGIFSLDGMKLSDHLGHAAAESRHFSPVFRERFMGHIAAEYTPFHASKPEGEHLC
jgi:patatin-like phospholipase/acyl hydrolase